MFKYKESETIELKSKFNDDVITKEIVAFLNNRGGVIYIGVSDNGEIIGVDKIDDSLKRLSDIVSTKIEPLPTELITSNIIMEDSKSIIEITILKGFHPLYCIKKHGFSQSGCPIRIGTSCKEMSVEEINLRYKKRFESSNDYMLEIPSNYGDISFNTIQIELSNKGYHINPLSFEENYHLRNKNGEYNQLAELLSDNNNTHLIFVKFRGNTKTSISERSNYGRTSLITSYKQIRDRLIAENICMTNTTVRPRKDTYLYDMDAVNEALINALVHNDWNINEPLISMYDDRLEILSHGGLPFNQTKEKFLRGISVPRNRGLMRIFQDLEITESTGHGIIKIIESYGSEVFEFSDSFINVSIPFNKDVLSNHDTLNGTLNGTLGGTANDELSEQETKLIGELLVNPKLTQDKLGEILGVSRRTISRYMSDLQHKKIIIKVGSKKDGYWKVLK